MKNKNNGFSPSPKAGTGSGPAEERDRVVRVFVSSTFRDMIEDRNELMSQVWPALRKLCRGRAVEFVDVDLRWGITEEMSQRQETVRHCLAEIKRCRPYFIGLLGERYGWVPGAEAYPKALLDEENWLAGEVSKRSVTELEILHGVLNDPDMAGRAFFYFRDRKYVESVPQDKKTDFTSENADAVDKLAKLKEKIRTTCAAKKIPLREGDAYTNPQRLAALVLADLTIAINAEFPPDQVPDVWAREDRDHEAYAKSRRTQFYVGRDAYFKKLDAFAGGGADGCGMTVLGESGGGKSALLANWVANQRKAHPADFVFHHYIGSSPMSAGHLALMRRLMTAIVRWCGESGAESGTRAEEEKIPAKAEEIVKAFPEYLGRLAFRAKQKGVHAVIVLDALNQLEDLERGRLLAWLPNRLPGELRLVVSTLPGDTLESIQKRGWPTLKVEPLTADERVQLIALYLAHFSQGLSDARARKIAAVSAAANPLYLKTLLDDLRATGAYDRLDTQIDDYLQATDIPALFGKILTRYEHDYERDRPGLVREALSLLWAARRGLTEPELLELLKPEGKSSLPAAYWSPVRCALEDGLVDRDGVLAFTHEHLRAAVESAFVSDEDKRDEVRLQLADYFETQPILPRSCDELPWLLWQTESLIRLRDCILNIDRFLLIHERDQNELMGYWVGMGEERVMGKPYLESFEAWSQMLGHQDQHISFAVSCLVVFLDHAALHTEAEPLMRRALAIDEVSFGKDHPNVARDLNNLAQLLQATNRLAEAEPLLLRAVAIFAASLGASHPNTKTVANNYAALLRKMGRSDDEIKATLRKMGI